MKYGIRIRVTDNTRKLLKKIDKYDFIFFGSETCENLMYKYEEAIINLNMINKPIIVSIPFLSESGINYLKKLIKIIKENFNLSLLSFSVNDFGAVKIVRENFPDLNISIGRHLTKYFFSLSLNDLHLYNKISYELIRNRYKISTYEISQIRFENIKDLNCECEFIVHLNYALLSTAKYCIIGSKELNQNEVIERVECDYSCFKGKIFLASQDFREKLCIIENSLYLKFRNKIRISEHKNVKAIVFDF